MNQPFVSVIMTAYNAENFITETIESVLGQSFTNFEFIIIDDCSKDKTVQVIRNFSDERIILIQKNENKGLPGYVENLNSLLELSKGKYIARIDHDDIWHKTKLEKQVKFLEENPEISLTGCSKANKIDEKGKQIGTLNLLPEHTDYKNYILKKNPLLNPTIVFRKELDTKYRWKMYFCEDYDFHLVNFSENIKYHIADEIMIDYRILPTSMSHNNKVLERALFVNQAKKFYHERLKNNGKDSYEDFDPEEILNIRNFDFKNKKEILQDALKMAFIANLPEDYKIIYKKLKNQNGLSGLPIYYKLFAKNLSFFTKIYKIAR